MDTIAINKARIVYYGLFAALFACNLDRERYHIITQSIGILAANPIDEQSAKAFANMKRRLDKSGYSGLVNERDRLFFSPTTAFVPMTASYYHEQRDDGRKRVEMIDYVQESSFRRNGERYTEHEDHIEFMLLFIQRLIEQDIAGDGGARRLADKIFANILNPMLEPFGETLYRHEQSFFYKQAVLALRSFIEFERTFLNIPPPARETARQKKMRDTKGEASGTCVRLGAGNCC